MQQELIDKLTEASKEAAVHSVCSDACADVDSEGNPCIVIDDGDYDSFHRDNDREDFHSDG